MAKKQTAESNKNESKTALSVYSLPELGLAIEAEDAQDAARKASKLKESASNG